jgi:hypothetical protein
MTSPRAIELRWGARSERVLELPANDGRVRKATWTGSRDAWASAARFGDSEGFAAMKQEATSENAAA